MRSIIPRFGFIGGLLWLLSFAATGAGAQGTGACWTEYRLAGAAAQLPAKGVKAFAGGDILVVGEGFAARMQAGKLEQTPLPAIPAALGAPLLQSVDGVAPDDVWAVGFSPVRAGNGSRSSMPVALHWDGRAWTFVPGPTFPNLTELYGVLALATDDVWAVGVEFHDPPSGRPVIEHWDGQTWRLVEGLDALGDPGFSWFSGGLRSISGSAGNLWAAGAGAVLHWNGAEWSVAYRGDGSESLQGVSAAGAGDVWVVGTTHPEMTGLISALLLHWDGRTWSGGSAPERGNGSQLNAIAATGPGDFWAVGATDTYGSSGRPVVVRRSQNTISLVGVEQIAQPPGSSLNAIDVAADGDVWLAGRSPALIRYKASCGNPRSVPAGRTFPETNRTLWGRFYEYWQEHGGLEQLGYPISGQFGEVSEITGQRYTVQYFERAVFEYHPENAPPHDVLLSQLGRFRYDKKYPNGAPGQLPNRRGGQFFAQTGHWVGGEFWDYWQSHGGLARQGFPLSDEFVEVSELNGRRYTVQYFERAVYEYHPENQAPHRVLLSQLGLFRGREKYPHAFPDARALLPLAGAGR